MSRRRRCCTRPWWRCRCAEEARGGPRWLRRRALPAPTPERSALFAWWSAIVLLFAALILLLSLPARGERRPECWDGSCAALRAPQRPQAPRESLELRDPPPPGKSIRPVPWWRAWLPLLAALKVRCLPMVLP